MASCATCDELIYFETIDWARKGTVDTLEGNASREADHCDTLRWFIKHIPISAILYEILLAQESRYSATPLSIVPVSQHVTTQMIHISL